MFQGDHLINGQWVSGDAEPLRSIDPASNETVWEGCSAGPAMVDAAVAAARAALPSWSGLDVESRIALLDSFARQLEKNKDDLALAISREIGKPNWEALAEVDAMIGKIPVSIDAYGSRRQPTEKPIAGSVAAMRFKPFGVAAVIGPFNFPGHLPNGHIVPALLAGNAVVFKPSELAPAVAEITAALWLAAGAPPGVINVIHGGGDTGAALAAHGGIDGLYFTGGAHVGKKLARAWAEHPGKILALEMGGNNPLVVHDAADHRAAAYLAIQSAYLTSGQRCTCARRLIVPRGDAGDEFVQALVAMIRTIRVGPHTDRPEPFMGPVVTGIAADRLLRAQQHLISHGGRPLLEMDHLSNRHAMLSPGLIEVTAVADRPDEEVFGPLLQLIRVDDFDAAIDEANRTVYGLAAGLLCDDRSLYERFFRRVRAGCINWNRPLTGASGGLPFGGVGDSGNNRPSGYYAADYCSYPIASLEAQRVEMPDAIAPGITP